MKEIITALLIVFFLTSCNQEKKEKGISALDLESTNKNDENHLDIQFSFKTDSHDKLRVNMLGIEVDEFQKKNIVFVEDIEPNNSYEELKVVFDKGNLSSNININLGFENEKTITMKDFRFSYGTKQVLVNSANYDKYLGHNIFVKRDTLRNTFTTSKIVGKAFNPIIFLRQTLINELKEH